MIIAAVYKTIAMCGIKKYIVSFCYFFFVMYNMCAHELYDLKLRKSSTRSVYHVNNIIIIIIVIIVVTGTSDFCGGYDERNNLHSPHRRLPFISRPFKFKCIIIGVELKPFSAFATSRVTLVI